jgi:hypothetical protein
MSKPITRRSLRPITRRVAVPPKPPAPPSTPDEVRRAETIQRVMAASPLASLERRVAALEEKLEAMKFAPTPTPVSVDEVTERALEARLEAIAETIEAAAAQRALDAVGPQLDELVAERVKKIKPSIDPRTLTELVDQRLKEALEPRFRTILSHLENEVVPRVLRKHASGL